jgi:L-malate glycosyltransferase
MTTGEVLSDQSIQNRIALLYDCVYPFVPGGGQKRLFEVARRLTAKGWQVDWYGLKSWPEPGIIAIDGIRFIPVADSKSLYDQDGKRSILQTLFYGFAVSKIPALRHYDIIHLGQWPYFHFFPVRAYTLFSKTRISADWWEVWAAHWLDYYGKKGVLGILLERLCARIPSLLVAISETGAKQLESIGVRRDQISVIHNGIDWRAIHSASPSPDGSDLIYVGRLQPHKNVDCLLHALALLRDRKCTLSLTIVGDGPERAALESLTRQLGLKPQIRFLGALPRDEDVHSHLKAARIFVHPSTKEGGGSITSLEANAAGLPVIAFRHPGGISPELIQEGVNGHWVDEVNPAALADGVVRALRHLNDTNDAASCCETFASSYDWDLIAAKYHDLFVKRIDVR